MMWNPIPPGTPPQPGYPSSVSASGTHVTAPSIVVLLVPSAGARMSHRAGQLPQLSGVRG